MKSSMAITKSAAFRFMLLLHLFLKVKMCVGFVDALATGDSDINYEDSDEWLRDVSGGRLAGWVKPWPVSTTTSRPVPSSLMRWEEPTGGHAGRYRMHHVRHEQHYLKHRPIKPVPNAGEATMVALDPDLAHTVTGSEQQEQKSRHHNNHHTNHHSHHHNPHHHQHHHVQHLDKQDRKSGASDASDEKVSLMELTRQDAVHRTASHPFERRTLYEKKNFNDVWDSLSGGNREVQDRQVAINRKRSASAFHSLTSNALTVDAGSKGASDRTTKTAQQFVNPRSKNYFEELLNNYKSSSPYYKELHQARSPQTKALPTGKRNQRSSAEATKSVSKSKAAPAARPDDDLDYLYDDETDDSVQNDAPSGGAMSTSTRAPSTTTTTTTTTTSTTTARSIESLSDDSDESSDGAASEADTSYSSYYQKAYAMHSNPRRNGNNRYNSIGTRPQLSVPQQQQLQSHSKRLHSDRIDPAKQVSFPGRYESLTDYKQANFGSKDAVERSYSAYNNIHNARREAMNHLDRMHTEGRCQVPRPKIVPASNDRTKIFTPHCTILHRCEDDTGCCMPPLTCAPKSTAEVKLFFYVSNDTSVKNVGPRQQNTVTTLTFTNHTECHCVQLDSVHGQSANSRPQIQNSLEQTSAEGSGGSSGGATGRISNSCTCPRHYKSVFDNESQCYCDCLSSDRDCIRFKEGVENFSMETRKCIRSKKCNVPHCEYGMYNRHEGRCPKKSDRMNEHFSQYR
ncbi:uncharacterized protein LOC126565832 [Anopheles maculipalpis]|uniref:uncharacterized protein LOC126565832 n=1 Tax=Anopheles maculipalpis TaxID=1496333 RepID=UPI002159233F|nr:uncharacterized protein LOC126565832 [Anopheles maculipalpis]